MNRQRVIHAYDKAQDVRWSEFQPGFGRGRGLCNKKGDQVVAALKRDVTCERCKKLLA